MSIFNRRQHNQHWSLEFLIIWNSYLLKLILVLMCHFVKLWFFEFELSYNHVTVVKNYNYLTIGLLEQIWAAYPFYSLIYINKIIIWEWKWEHKLSMSSRRFLMKISHLKFVCVYYCKVTGDFKNIF